ncbi:MAG: OmpA family protein [Acidobacteria bacterium]|nr:OmpA family protein [Acidobacteriota bacterium]
MRKHLSIVVVALAALVLLAGLFAPASADAKRYRAFVYPDRTKPEMSVVVDDFRINETLWDEGGVQYVWLKGPAGNFKVPFSRIRQIEVLAYRGPDTTKSDWVWYDVLVTGVGDAETYTGRIEIRVMRGLAEGVPWYSYPATDPDRGSNLWRIVVGDERLAPTIPWQAPAPAASPVPVVPEAPAPPPPAPPPAPTKEDLFAQLSLAELNKQAPLVDVYFDFDMATLRPDGELAMQRNADWMKKWPSVKVRVEGCADPRGTNEYNLTLGRHRAETVRDFLVAQGIPADRIEVVQVGEENLVCTVQNEACWARNRRDHFVITAK